MSDLRDFRSLPPTLQKKVEAGELSLEEAKSQISRPYVPPEERTGPTVAESFWNAVKSEYKEGLKNPSTSDTWDNILRAKARAKAAEVPDVRSGLDPNFTVEPDKVEPKGPPPGYTGDEFEAKMAADKAKYQKMGPPNPEEQSWFDMLRAKFQGSKPEPKADYELPERPSPLRPPEEPKAEAPTSQSAKASAKVKEETWMHSGVPRGKAELELPEEKATPFAESQIQLEIDGKTETGTPTELSNKAAAALAKQQADLIEEFRKEDDAARSGAMWAEIIRGVASLAVAQYGIKHGVDLSGFKLAPIDWVDQQRVRSEAVKTKLGARQSAFEAVTGAAKEAKDTQVRTHQMSEAEKWRAYETKVNRLKFKEDQMQRYIDNVFKDRELGLRAASLAAEIAARREKGNPLNQDERKYLSDLHENLQKSSALEKEKPEEAKAAYNRAFQSAVLLGKTRPDLVGDPKSWTTIWTKESPPGIIDSVKASLGIPVPKKREFAPAEEVQRNYSGAANLVK